MTKLADKGGNQEFALMGTLSSQAIYSSFSDLVEFLYKKLNVEYIKTVYANNVTTCEKVFNSSIDGLSTNDLLTICSSS